MIFLKSQKVIYDEKTKNGVLISVGKSNRIRYVTPFVNRLKIEFRKDLRVQLPNISNCCLFSSLFQIIFNKRSLLEMFAENVNNEVCKLTIGLYNYISEKVNDSRKKELIKRKYKSVVDKLIEFKIHEKSANFYSALDKFFEGCEVHEKDLIRVEWLQFSKNNPDEFKNHFRLKTVGLYNKFIEGKYNVLKTPEILIMNAPFEKRVFKFYLKDPLSFHFKKKTNDVQQEYLSYYEVFAFIIQKGRHFFSLYKKQSDYWIKFDDISGNSKIKKPIEQFLNDQKYELSWCFFEKKTIIHTEDDEKRVKTLTETSSLFSKIEYLPLQTIKK